MTCAATSLSLVAQVLRDKEICQLNM